MEKKVWAGRTVFQQYGRNVESGWHRMKRLAKKILRNEQDSFRREMRIKERTNDNLAKKLSQITREAE